MTGSVMVTATDPCADCRRLMIPRRAWKRLAAEERAGKVCAQAHGRCCGCYHRTRPPRRRAVVRRRNEGLDAVTLGRLRRAVGVRSTSMVEGGDTTP